MWKGKLLHAAETLRYMSCLYSFAVSRADSTSPSNSCSHVTRRDRTRDGKRWRNPLSPWTLTFNKNPKPYLLFCSCNYPNGGRTKWWISSTLSDSTSAPPRLIRNSKHQYYRRESCCHHLELLLVITWTTLNQKQTANKAIFTLHTAQWQMPTSHLHFSMQNDSCSWWRRIPMVQPLCARHRQTQELPQTLNQMHGGECKLEGTIAEI